MSEVIEEGLRFVFAGSSIVSDWGSPAATTNRAVMTALVELGYEATYLEPRRDESLVELLKARGSQPMRSFLEAYPALQYRTVDLPEPFQASAWAGQFLATASAAITLLGCPVVIEAAFRQFESAEMRFLTERTEGAGSILVEGTADSAVTPYQPAVLPRTWNTPRSGTLLVAYDDAELALVVAGVVQPDTMVVSGKANLPDWEWVPEVELPQRYGRAERVLVVDGAESLSPARVWLARANGATAWSVAGAIGGELAQVGVTIGQIDSIDWNTPTPVIDSVDARRVAARLARAAQARNVVSMNGKG